jgi:hypothetical protein
MATEHEPLCDRTSNSVLTSKSETNPKPKGAISKANIGCGFEPFRFRVFEFGSDVGCGFLAARESSESELAWIKVKLA